MRESVFQVDSAAEIKGALSRLGESGVDWVKVMFDEIPLGTPQLSTDLLEYAIEAAHECSHRVAVHVGSDHDARLAVRYGADMLAHGVYLDSYSEATLNLSAERQTFVVPTVGVIRNMDQVMPGEYDPVPYLQELQGAEQLKALTEGRSESPPQEMQAWLEILHNNQDRLLSNARRLGEEGIVWLVGSDSPFFGWTAGQALYTEMELLVEAGYSPAEVLQAVTDRRNARALGLSNRGRIEEGLRADLLLVEGDPTESITNAHNIVEIFKAGQRVQRTPP